MALKLDMAKAYDRVEWSFLEGVLHHMGFPVHWVSLIMRCVSTVSFSIMVNGQPHHNYSPHRGLRQGDPLSPYLFNICSEVFSSMIRHAVEESALHGMKVDRTAPQISHFLFADDSIIFARATIEEA